ncbi:DUF397 domain-containing protein [Streptomyces sp. DSM 40484]|uniref:DUF397 domain-containing protein n=1 Tax=Streptomyces kroppenstedtii TaxID=3051181 RepID=UPI0028D7E1A8|nr:DUF397 domain-containing protein [Streptomyces sp. DSM 40484]
MTQVRWQRSSFSGDGGNNCVEVAATTNGAALRESDSPTEVLATSQGALLSLIRGIKTATVPSTSRSVRVTPR